ncbi:hypothetical protein F5887DRAFT_144634 [Amanita rubescens]|nr:hypothetical protein F5887DRAFT_144634 [Amanita rubescens]
MDCDQPAGSSSDQESRPSQPPEAIVVPVSKASNSRGPRSNRKKSASTLIPMGRMTRSAASKLKATEPPATRSALRSNIPVTPRVTRLRSASTASPSGKSVTDTQRKGGSSKAALVADITFSSGTAGSSLPGKPSNYARPTTSSTAKVTKSPVKSSKASAFKPSRPSSTPGSRASSPGPFSRLFPAKVSSRSDGSLFPVYVIHCVRKAARASSIKTKYKHRFLYHIG